MKKIGYIAPIGRDAMSIYFDEKEKYNPYRVYREWSDPVKHRRVKRLVEKYADIESAVAEFSSYLNATRFLEDDAFVAKLAKDEEFIKTLAEVLR